MKTNTKKYIASPRTKVLLMVLFLVSLMNAGCDDFLEVDDPTGQISNNAVFENDETATAAVTSLYGKLRDQVILTANFEGTSPLMGLYSDELDSYSTDHSGPIYAFYNHTIIAPNSVVKSIWDGSYNLIFMSNSALEGIAASHSLSPEVKKQLTGEALFVRALTHFYLVNLYGDIPYITTTDYLVNQEVSRMPTETVYEKIINDLSEAKELLTEQYVSGERVRANRYAVSALLARVYLYMQHWQQAESESSMLINTSSLFHLETDVNNEFLRESSSAILQLKPKNPGDPTLEAAIFLFVSGPPSSLALTPNLVQSFEEGDLRRSNWISDVTDGSQVWYAPYKYKQRELSGSSTEYSIALRLAEQYLIRAEARVHTGNLSGARQDINIIRNRAGLPDTDAVSTQEILESVMQERRHELFTEHGHRWFDLKRRGQAGEVLAPLKPNWKSTDIILPIPEVELLMNPNLAPQNPGY